MSVSGGTDGCEVFEGFFRVMKIGRSKHRNWIALAIVLIFTTAPFFDSLACDDFARGSPCPGGGIEIRCKHFLDGNNWRSPKDAGSNGQSSSDENVHAFCPICFSIAPTSFSYDIGFPRAAAIFRLPPLLLCLAQTQLSIYKPPQN